MDEQQIRKIIRDELSNFLKYDRYFFDQNIQVMDTRNIQLGKKNGTKIGTEATQKIGFYGVTPVVQAATISSPSGGGTQDSQARNAVNSLINAAHNIGIIA